MAGSSPSPQFERLVNLWRHLSLRSDVDDIIQELLGRFSLEKIYAGGDPEAYRQLVVNLLVQLNVILYIQRLTLPGQSLHAVRYLGFLVSWEVTLRTIEFVLQVVVEGREGLWEARQLTNKHLAEFLLSALRILTLHPRSPANQRARERRDRFARVHRSLEQIFDSYPGPKSSLLTICKEVTNQLHVDSSSLELPRRLKSELPTLASELYPLSACLLPPYILELVPQGDMSVSWLAQLLALHDISQFIVGASIQYVVNQETRDIQLQTSAAASRDAVLQALNNLRTPSNLSKVDLLHTFSNTFHITLPDTLALTRSGQGPTGDDSELDAMDAFYSRLAERQIVHRISDGELMHGITRALREILLQDNPRGQFPSARPSLYVVNCSKCHFFGGSELASLNIQPPDDPEDSFHLSPPPNSSCSYCGESITLAREIPLARRTCEMLRPLEPDVDAINFERHLPTQFLFPAPRADVGGVYQTDFPIRQRQTEIDSPFPERYIPPEDPYLDPSRHDTLSPQQSLESRHPSDPTYTETNLSHLSDSVFSYGERGAADASYNTSYTKIPPSQSPSDVSIVGSPERRGSDGRPSAKPPATLVADPRGPNPPRTLSLPTITEKAPDKGKSRWRNPFTSARRSTTVTSGDSSSLSSGVLEAQKLEEISLASMTGPQKASGRGKGARSLSVTLSHNSPTALFWNQQSIQVWDLNTSPRRTHAIQTESTCILATLASAYLAYVIGTRDQRLTLRIVNLAQPSVQVIEHRIPSPSWCRSIAIDRSENYVVVGFENSLVRFFSTAKFEPPREDHLHRALHTNCRHCPPVETLSFSHDGLVLLASTRSAKTGLIQVYMWKFPFVAFYELTTCRYLVQLHESEDNGISSVMLRAGGDGEDGLVCIATWTQSGTPILAQPRDAHKSFIRREVSSRSIRLGNRIQCADFSPSGSDLAMVNDKGHLYRISNLNSNPMDIHRIATSKELTTKTDTFAIAYMTLLDEECIVLAWTDSSKGVAWVKKIPVDHRDDTGAVQEAKGLSDATASPGYDIPPDIKELEQPPVELPTAEH